VNTGGGALTSSFRFCPSCGREGIAFLQGKRWLCASCGFEYFHNVATAAGVIIEVSRRPSATLGEIVLVERAHAPCEGKLGLPGGFVDPGERAEDAALRECREEIGWAPPSLGFIGSFPNSYEYGEVAYSTCDLFFYYRFPAGSELPSFALCDGEALSIQLVALAELDSDSLAFPSTARAIEAYRKLPTEYSK
jgi:NAD+ diphosphatase